MSNMDLEISFIAFILCIGLYNLVLLRRDATMLPSPA